MSDLNGPKKETVRITLPPRVPPGGSGSGTSKIALPAQLATAAAEPARRILPPPPPPSRRLPPPPPPRRTEIAAHPAPAIASVAPPVAPVTPPPPPMPPRPRVLPPPPRAISPGGNSGSVSDAPSHYPGSGTQNGPRKETARITIRPEPATPMAATVKMAKTQPLLTVPAAGIPSASVFVAAEEVEDEPDSLNPLDLLDRVPLPVCWPIFGISAITLLIQIWNYVSS